MWVLFSRCIVVVNFTKKRQKFQKAVFTALILASAAELPKASSFSQEACLYTHIRSVTSGDTAVQSSHICCGYSLQLKFLELTNSWELRELPTQRCRSFGEELRIRLLASQIAELSIFQLSYKHITYGGGELEWHLE